MQKNSAMAMMLAMTLTQPLPFQPLPFQPLPFQPLPFQPLPQPLLLPRLLPRPFQSLVKNVRSCKATCWVRPSWPCKAM